MSLSGRSPLYDLAHEVVEAYGEEPAGRRLAQAVDALDRALNEIDQSLAMLDALREAPDKEYPEGSGPYGC